MEVSLTKASPILFMSISVGDLRLKHEYFLQGTIEWYLELESRYMRSTRALTCSQSSLDLSAHIYLCRYSMSHFQFINSVLEDCCEHGGS